ncbi:MAG: creatininase family protein [Clostridia bacterium]|nr:creatininase family protein [Clostridia bacterium]
MAYYMNQMSVRDMEEAIQKTKTVIIPTGVVEQHGYHLPLSTDILNATRPLEIAGDKLNAVVAPVVNYCFSGGDLLGTVNVSPNTFGLYISEICSEFVRMGFENIIVFLGHAGTDNINALRNSLQMLLRRNPEMHEKITISLVECWKLSPTWLSGFNLEPEHDFHAGMMETSLMMYWNPELVGDEIVMDDEYISRMMRTDQDWFEKREKRIDSPFMIEKVGQRDEIKVGVMGLPHEASRELGEKICNEIVDNLVEYVNVLEANRKG